MRERGRRTGAARPASCAATSSLRRLGRLDEASALIAETRTIVEALGEWIWIVSWHVAAVARWLGDPRSAEQEVRPAYDALKAIGEKSHFSTMAQGLAVALYMQGRYEDAEHVIRECQDAARPNDVYSQIMIRSILAKVLAQKGHVDEAKRLASEAVEYASRRDFHLGHADALLDLSEVLELTGDHSAALTALEEAQRFYELKGNVLGAELARERLSSAAPAGRAGQAGPYDAPT